MNLAVHSQSLVLPWVPFCQKSAKLKLMSYSISGTVIQSYHRPVFDCIPSERLRRNYSVIIL